MLSLAQSCLWVNKAKRGIEETIACGGTLAYVFCKLQNSRIIHTVLKQGISYEAWFLLHRRSLQVKVFKQFVVK